MKYGIELLSEQPGDGPAVERHESYRIRVKMWLNRGDPVRWESPSHVCDECGAIIFEICFARCGS